MKKTVNYYDFVRAFQDSGRGDQFSLKALGALFDYIEEYEEGCGEEIELDVVGLCCDWREEHWQDIADNYNVDLSDCGDEQEKLEAVEAFLEYHTQYVGMDEGAFIYVAF
jgi:hypothetical protein